LGELLYSEHEANINPDVTLMSRVEVKYINALYLGIDFANSFDQFY
jgi:hypothetical protein